MKDLVTALLSCSTSPDDWEDALDRFTDEFEITSSCMFSINEFHEFNRNFYSGRYIRDKFYPAEIGMMTSGGDTGDHTAYKFLFQNEYHRFYNDLQVFSVENYEELPASNVRTLTESHGLKMRAAATLNKNGPWTDTLFCQFKSDAEWRKFSVDSRTDFILPIFSNSIELGRTLQALRAKHQAALSALDALGLGVFLVDRTGCVIQYNKEASRILDQQDGIALTKSKQLKLNSNVATRQLELMISSNNGLLDGEFEVAESLIAAARPSGLHEYLISVSALLDEKAELEPSLRCAFVTVIDPTRADVLSAQGITTMAELSLAESEVVDLLIQGLRISDIAKQRDVSLNTIKTQLKVIFQKLRCSSQSDIIRAAAATRIPFAN